MYVTATVFDKCITCVCLYYTGLLLIIKHSVFNSFFYHCEWSDTFAAYKKLKC